MEEVDSFLEEVDDSQSANKDEQTGQADPACRERLLREVFRDAEPSLDGTFELQPSDDGMEVHLDCYPPHGEGKPIQLEDVEKQLSEADITYGVDWKLVQETLLTCNTERTQLNDVLIAKGKPPSPEVPEHFLIKKGLIKDGKKEPPTSEKQVDYREYSPFTIVEEGEVLAKIEYTREGIFGQTVKGAKIPYKRARINQVTPGENTELRGDTVVATCHGRFIYTSLNFAVKQILEIKTDVDYSTGNIDFPGDVFIYGEVKDRFSVRAGGSLYCSSTLDAYRVSCGGDLIVSGGIIGRKDGEVKAEGKISCRFIENCYVEAGGSISVKTGILKSVINTKDMLEMGNRGTLLGGKVFAQNGVRAHQIGSRSQAQTEINCGLDFSVQKKLFWIKDNLLKLVELKRKIEEKISRGTEETQSLQDKKQEIKNKIRKLSDASIALLNQLDKNDAAFVAVEDTIYSGAYIEICHTSFVVTKPLHKGRFTLNKKIGKITVGNV